MKRRSLYTGSVISVVLLVLALAGGVASAAPAANAPACVAGSRAPSHLSAPAAQRYAAFKDAQVERMSESGAMTQPSCRIAINVASLTITRPLAYAVFKDRQAGN